WSVFESQWVEFVELDVPVEGLPPELDGFRILHLSDFHLGALGLNSRTLARAVSWADRRDPDLVVVTGDLLTHPRGEATLRRCLARLPARYGAYAVLGNHDVAETRDPFSKASEIRDLDDVGVRLLNDSAHVFEARGVRVQVAGVSPAAYMLGRADPAALADPAVPFRILLCHFPEIVDAVPPGTYALALAGHLHGGQICVPYPGGKLRLSHVRGAYWEGVFRSDGTTLHVSRGLGTTFVPFRLFARPEATELVLRA
ncbi:MAG TPA: metallophosphoesterase, partial [Gaiellaceae bacterium]|nr:metallophosphoesterase [Gaiellaceae bacterium]